MSESAAGESTWRGAAHLVKRFLGTLRPGGPNAADREFADAALLPEERRLWVRMTSYDRRHAVGVAREVQRALGHEATRPVVAAALLHDVGKVEARLGRYGRVVATLAAAATRRRYVDTWIASRGFTRRVGLYLRHPKLGGDLLALAGSDPLTVAWAREHHSPPVEWSLPPHVATALKTADDD
jgi:hypothetical protein